MSDTSNSLAQDQIKRPHKGEIQIIFGPMFSGKSTELLRRVNRYIIRDDLCLLIKTKDNKFNENDEKIYTHDHMSLSARSCDLLFELVEDAALYDVIAIDDGQFFPDIIEFSDEMANRGKVVIVACLDSDFKREPFGCVCHLAAKSEKITKLSSICSYCGEDAWFSVRISGEKEVKVYGGLEKYQPVCRSCYFMRTGAECLNV
ncbi:unnamed protein product [Blepharisma stoltei]|uniref:Thymidine kinase n=1 Tax=Blepharisma stoltei TaxID=1481888 RepID=A0AAU9IJF9_9CILI|nr:unnamed protein product [Blepharisma stoltei]